MGRNFNTGTGKWDRRFVIADDCAILNRASRQEMKLPSNCAIKNRTSPNRLSQLQKEYYILRKKYIKAYDDLPDVKKSPSINLLEL